MEKEELKKEEMAKKDEKTTSKPENKKAEVKENTKKQNEKKDKKDKKNSENKKEQKEKSKNGYFFVGILLVIAIIIIVSILLIIPGTPRKTIDGMFSALKAGDFEKAQEYFNYQDLMETTELNGNDSENIKLFFDKLEWKINKITQEKDKATAEVEVTNKDFKTIISNYMQKVLKVAFSGQDITDEEMTNYLAELLKDESVQTTTTTKTIEVTKQDGKWRIVTDETLMDTILPGLQESINSLNAITE